MLNEATKSAQSIVADAHVKAASDIEAMIAKSEESMRLEREKLHQEIRSELADIVAVGLEKVTSGALKAADQKKLIEKTVKDL
jgi:F0F1-type ATP synthase membrane subunit b/b'